MKLSIVEESGAFFVRDEDSNMWLARGFWTLDRKNAKRHESRELANQSVIRYEALLEAIAPRREKGANTVRAIFGGKG